jgi:hypothetical protein
MISEARLYSPKSIILMAVALAAVCCNAKDKMENQPDLEKTVRSIVNWGDPGMNTPGATVELRPGPPIKRDGKIYDIFVPYLSGLPMDQSYAIFQWAINQPEPHVSNSETFIAPDGRLCLQAGTCHDEIGPYVQFGFFSANGEPFRIAFVSRDGKSKVSVLLVPRPITADDATCHVEVIRATPKFEMAIIRGKGFNPRKRAEYTSKSAGEVISAPLKVDINGNFVLVLAPFVKGNDQGVDEVVFKGDGCSPKVSYHWGTIED